MRSDAVLCARGVSIDRDTGALTIFQIIDGMQATGFPVLLQDFSVIVILERSADEPAQVPVLLQILRDDDLLLQEQVAIDFGPALRHRQAINLQGIVIQSPGIVYIKIRHNNADLGVYRFPVAASSPAALRR
jgi:hypothetical protein